MTIHIGPKVETIVLFETTTHIGLPIYICAIIINMIVSETMCSLEITDRRRYTPKMIRPLTISTWRWIVVSGLIGSAAVTLIGAWFLPFLKLTAVFLYHYQYSLFHVVLAMGNSNEYLFSVIVCFFCILMPVVKLFALGILWIRQQKPKDLDRNFEIVKAISKWSMLDVFCMAYCLFFIVRDDVVPGIIYKNGLWFLIIYLLINYTLDIITNLWMTQLIRKGTD